MRFDLLQFCCSPIFCRKKSSLLWRVPLRLLCLRQETAHPVDGFPLFIVQHMRIFLSGDNGGMAHEVLDDADGNILFHQPCGEGMPECVDIDPLQLTPFTNRLDPFLVGPGVGVGPPLGGEDKVLGIGMPLVKLDLPVEHKQPPDVFIDRRFPIAGLAFGGLLEDQLGFLAGWVVKELHPFQVLADADGPLLLVEVAPFQRQDLPHPRPGKEGEEHGHP